MKVDCLLATTGVVVLSCLLLSCSTRQAPNAPQEAELQSVYTELSGPTCKEELDMSDPNETPYLRCSGVAGYSLIVRKVGSGRKSIEVVDASGDRFPLDYQDVVTRHMLSLGEKAEWRVSAQDSKLQPFALIARVDAREDESEPERVTQSFFAVAKVEASGACVTDRIVVEAEAEAMARRAADSARVKPCLTALPEIHQEH
jgi:hypothetical protein